MLAPTKAKTPGGQPGAATNEATENVLLSTEYNIVSPVFQPIPAEDEAYLGEFLAHIAATYHSLPEHVRASLPAAVRRRYGPRAFDNGGAK